MYYFQTNVSNSLLPVAGGQNPHKMTSIDTEVNKLLIIL